MANQQPTTQSARAAATATSPTTGRIAQAAAPDHSASASATVNRSGRKLDAETSALLHSAMAANTNSPLRNGGQPSATDGGGGGEDGATFVELDAGSRDQPESVVCT